MPKLPTLLSRRGARIAGQAVIITALAGGTVAYASADTDVDLSVDGETREVSAFGDTVADILEAADVEVGSRDLVVPALEEEVSDGDDVVVRHAREVTLTVDGETKTYWTTALTVGDALQDLDVRAEGAQVSASRSLEISREGIDLEVVTPKDITIHIDGEVIPVTTLQPTAGLVLEEAGIEIDRNDRASVSHEVAPTDGMEIVVNRVETRPVVNYKRVPFTTEERRTDDLYEGERKVIQNGRTGLRTLTWTETLVDGERESLAKVNDVVTREAVTKVIGIGTKDRPAPKRETSRSSRSSSRSSSSSSSAPSVASGSVWDRLAQCESGGNWSINTGNGYYGGLQFSASSWRAVGGSGLPHQHSRATQIQMGERLKARQGWGAWPSCSRKLGLR